MNIKCLILLLCLFACNPPRQELFIQPKTKQSTDGANLLSEKLLTEYDIWEFLKENPTESAVIEMLGAPDSVWTSEEQTYYIMYYYRQNLEDYNSIELNTKTRKVMGYEWD